jgi:hypothetical protein
MLIFFPIGIIHDVSLENKNQVSIFLNNKLGGGIGGGGGALRM